MKEKKRTGYEQRDFEIVDYQTYHIENIQAQFRGPKPQTLEKNQYFVCVGAAQTFGCFCEKPYPNLLQKQLNLQVLNLSCGGAIPDWFLQKRELIEYINNAKFAIIQVMSARTVSNSLFESQLSGQKVIKRDSGIAITADEAYQQLIQTKDWHLLQKIVAETRQNWINSYKYLLEEIKVPKILLWFSIRKPDYQENYEQLEHQHQLFRNFPQMVNRDMINQIKSYCDDYVECVSSRGLPQLLISRFTDKPVTLTSFEGISQTHNNYYPSPEMHLEAANLLEPICKKYYETSNNTNNSKSFLALTKKNMSKSQKLIIHCCYHKVATVFFMQILRNIAKEFDWKLQISFSEKLTPISLDTNIFLQHNSEINLLEIPLYVGSHIIRDPRDMIISGYFYHLWCSEEWVHRKKPRFNNRSYQEVLNSLSKEEGIAMEISRCKRAINNMVSWDYFNPNIVEIKLEDLNDEKGVFTKIFQKYGFDEEQLEKALSIVERLGFEKIAGRKKGEEDQKSHFRKGVSGDWKNYFTPEHKKLFKEMYPEAVVKLGYEKDDNW
jgi:hypothetical protein